MWLNAHMREKAEGVKIMAVTTSERNGFSPRYSAVTTDSGTIYTNDDDFDPRRSSCSGVSSGYTQSAEASPFAMSPWNNEMEPSPYSRSPWRLTIPDMAFSEESYQANGLIGSLVREEGHIYSLAACRDLLYTGSESKNIRVWKNRREFGGFKATSGLVKAIIISGDRIFSGHQDGKIRVWKVSSKNGIVHKRVGTLPRTRDLLKRSLNPSNYVEVRRHKTAVWIKHHDAVSCLSLNEDEGLLYSGSWDKTVKVWRLSTSKCLESIIAHEDAVNAVVVGFDGLVFTGSADGTMKVWRREQQGKKTKHSFLQTLLSQECAITALAVNPSGTVVYCGSSDGVVNFWEREKLLSHGGVLRGHKLGVLCLATAGSLVFSGSADKSICVWRRDGTSHSCLSVLYGHTGPVKCMAVEADADTSPYDRRWILYTGSLDKSVKVWRVSEVASELSQPASLSDSPSMPAAQLVKSLSPCLVPASR